jgi:hypothetical protein
MNEQDFQAKLIKQYEAQGWLAMYASDTRQGAPPPESAANFAYAYADAMLKAREQ